MRSVQELKADLLAYLAASHERVTMAELAREFPEFRNGKQGCVMCENLLAWGQMTAEAAAAFQDLVNEKTVILRPCSVACHEADGVSMSLPVADQFRDHETLHWYPVCMRIGSVFASNASTAVN
jgi:hypothetical protein